MDKAKRWIVLCMILVFVIILIQSVLFALYLPTIKDSLYKALFAIVNLGLSYLLLFYTFKRAIPGIYKRFRDKNNGDHQF